MGSEIIFFYVFGAIAVAASLLVIAQTNPIYSVLLLIASFGALSGLYVLLEAPFVAVIQIIVYAGAIMVLFLFVVMLLNAPHEDTEHDLHVHPLLRKGHSVSALRSPRRSSSSSCGRSRRVAASPAHFLAARCRRWLRLAGRSLPTTAFSSRSRRS